MAVLRDGVIVTYDIKVDEFVPVTVEYVTGLEELSEAAGRACSINRTLCDMAFLVARGGLPMETFRRVTDTIMDEIKHWKRSQ